MSLPDGVHARPLTTEDIDDTVAMVNACELHDSGELMLERADLLADSRTVGFDLTHDWIGVFEGNRIVGRGLFVHRRSAWIDVHPSARGRGIGTGCDGGARIGHGGRRQPDRADDRGSAHRRDRAAPARRLHAAEDFVDPADGSSRATPGPTPPDGIRLRPFEPGGEDEASRCSKEPSASGRIGVANAPGTWRAMVTDARGSNPTISSWRSPDDRIVGGAFLIDADGIWVDKLAVEREFRHRGIARALLQTAFRRSFDRGYAGRACPPTPHGGAVPLRAGGHADPPSFAHFSLDLR